MLKKILLALIFVITAITSVTHAEDDMKTVASKAYVDTKIETKQLKIPAAGQPNVGAGETVMTYTANGNGEIGERGLYSDASSYNAATDADKLITASALKDTFTNLPTTDTTKLECANQDCTLWTIVDQSAYGDFLPEGYTRLEFIESTGTQYISTGVSGFNDGDWEIYAKFMTTDTTQVGYASVLNVYKGGDYNAYTVMLASDGNPGRYVINANNKAGGGAVQVNNKPAGQVHEVTLYNNSFVFDGTTYSANTTGTTLPSSTVMTLFARSSNALKWKGRIYHTRVKKNNVMKYNMIPAKHDSDNKYGMYDTVTGTFFTNAMTSGPDFTAGPVAN